MEFASGQTQGILILSKASWVHLDPTKCAPVTFVPGIKWRVLKITSDPPPAPRFRMHVAAPISAVHGGKIREIAVWLFYRIIYWYLLLLKI